MAAIGPIKPSTYILGIIFFTGMILAGMGMIGEFRQADPTFMGDAQTTAFNSTFNQYDELTASVNSLQGSTTSPGNLWQQAAGAIGSLFGSAWNALILLYTSFGFMNSIFAGLAMFGVPGWVGALLGLAVIVIIAFAIISAISQTDL